MRRSPFRRAPVERSLEGDASTRVTDGPTDTPSAGRAALPIALEAALDVALDERAPHDARLAALARLEHGARAHGVEVARRLAPALGAPPDVAARAHLALLVLAPRLAVGRDEDGRFVASARPLDEARDDGLGRVDPTLGPVAGLDALASLFGPGEDAPLFLGAPPREAPAPYRPAVDVLARRGEEERAASARAARRERLRALGLEEDDLFDDVEERLPSARRHVPRRDAAVLIEVDAPCALVLETAAVRVPLGTASAGAWWSDVRVGDHKGSQRLVVRLAQERASDDTRVRRVPTLSAPAGVVTLVFGGVRVEHVVGAELVVPFIERVEVQGDARVIGVSLSWRPRGVRSGAR